MRRLGLIMLVLLVSACLDTDSDTTPIFEKGLVAPEQHIPCYHHDTGQQAASCNHHGSSVWVESDGTVLVVWYTGISEKSKDSNIVWSKRPPGGEFSDPMLLYDEPDLAEGNPAIWTDENGKLLLFFMTIFGENWDDAKVRMMTSADRGATWSPVKELRDDWNWMVRNHPLRLSSGELLLPLYDESYFVPTFMISNDDFDQQWTEIPENIFDGTYLLDHSQQIQPAVIERDDGTLFVLNRNATNLGGDNRRASQMTSDDLGRTWSPISLSEVPNSGVGLDMVKLANGHVVVAFNNSPNRRFPLAAALSTDDGRTWSRVGTLNDECATGGCSYGYTSIAQDPTNSSLWVTYTHNRDTIGWIHFNEAWLQAQTGSLNYLDN